MIELQVGELFSGAGGLGLGFLLASHPQIRFRPLFAVDNDSTAVKSHAMNMAWLAKHAPNILPTVPKIIQEDVEHLNASELLKTLDTQPGKLDLLIGGPPCQGFSSANRKGANREDRNRLIKVFLDKVSQFQPKMFLLENVQGVRWTKPTQDMIPVPFQGSLFSDDVPSASNVQQFLIDRARSLGYQVWAGVLNAVDFGVPQHRMRFFLFGVSNELTLQEDSISLTKYLEQQIDRKAISVEEAIGDLPALNNGQTWQEGLYEPGSSDYVAKMRQHMATTELYDHYTTRHAEYVIERYKLIPQGKNWEAIREQMQNYAVVENTHSNIYRRLKSDLPAHTISHYRKSMVIHPSQHRGISMREACRLQSFPDWFRFAGGSDTQQQQLANAVPPLMAAAVAWAIGEFYSHDLRH